MATSLPDLLYEFLKKITSATSGATEDLAMTALLTALDPEFAITTQLPEGGTTGQVLAKNSNTDYDTEWIDTGGSTYVRATWFAEISSGTSGTITPPMGSTIILDAWAGGIDVLVSEMSGASGLPTYSTAVTSTSVAVTGTLDVDGNWTLSGTPSSYPVALIYVYRSLLTDLDDSKSLSTVDVEEGKTIRGQYNTVPQLTASATPATVDLDYSAGNQFVIDRVTNNPASFTITESNRPTGTGKGGLITVIIKCDTEIAMSLPAGYPAVVLVASKTNKFNLSSYYDHHAAAVYLAANPEATPEQILTAAMVYQSKHLGSW
jgi:hypothetical protein